MVKHEIIDHISLDGGILCLDFVNSVHNRKKEPPESYFQSFEELLYWSKKLKITDPASFRLMEQSGLAKKQRASAFFKEAIEIRELLYRIFGPISHQRKSEGKDISEFNKIYSAYLPFLKLKQVSDHFEEYWDFVPDDFKQIIAPILKSAHELLLSGKLERVKECPNCGWLFFDHTKNGKRRWCSMKNCGSSVKALEWYYRQKEN